MKIEKLMSRPVRACAPTDTLATAAHLMWEGDCGLVPVIDVEGRCIGVVTDRDVCMSALFGAARLDEMPVARAMSREPVTVRADASLHDALEQMRVRQVRRLPVVDAEGQLVGILSLADVAGLWGPSGSTAERGLHADDLALTLAGVCRARGQEPSAVMVVEVTPRARGEEASGARAEPPPVRPSRKPRTSKGARTRSKSKKA